MRAYLGLLVATTVCLSSPGAWAQDGLNVGDAAPPLAVSRWLKGGAVDRLEPGKTYVVDFWATWCDPRDGILHLTELAHRYKDKGIRFIGIAAREFDTKSVKPFVDEMGDRMDYSVALDLVPKGGDSMDGAMSKTWLKAAREGIPTCFLVHDGKIAWIGEPLWVDGPLAGVVAGDWDPGDFARTRLAKRTWERKMALLHRKVLPFYHAGNYKATVAVLDDETRGYPFLSKLCENMKFAALCKGADVERGLVLGAKALKAYGDEPSSLYHFFFLLFEHEPEDELDPRVAQLELQAIRRIVELTKGEDTKFLEILAEAQYRTGDIEGAVATSERVLIRTRAAIKAVYKDRPDSPEPSTERLDFFREAAAKRAKR